MPADPSITAPPPATAPGGLLAEIAAGLANGGDLARLLERFLEPIVRLAGAEAGAVRVLSDAGDELRRVGAWGRPEDQCRAGPVADSHCSYCGAAAADGLDVVWADDLGTCSARTPGASAAQGCRQMLVVPLRHRGRTLGVYNLTFDGSHKPGPEVLALLRSVGELLGLALNNSRLEQERLRATLASERQLMAAEVHDSIAQALAFARMRMPLLHDAMRAHDDERALQYYDDVRRAMSQAHAGLRGVITHFRTPMDPRGLVQALADSAASFRRNTGAELEFVNELPALELPAEQEAQVFHIVQEALTNIARHAGARRARLHIAAARPGELAILVEDDGTGLAAAIEGGAHYGMEIMQERARRLGGTLEVGSGDAGGTRVRLAFPAPGVAAPSPPAGPVARGAAG